MALLNLAGKGLHWHVLPHRCIRLEAHTPLIITVQWMCGNVICYRSAVRQRHQTLGYKTTCKVQLVTGDSQSLQKSKIRANSARGKARGTS